MRLTLEKFGLPMILVLALTIMPAAYVVEFDPHPDNVAIVLIVASAGKYRSVNRFEISPTQHRLEVVRQYPLAPGRYTVTAVLMHTSDTDPNGEEAGLVVENIEEK